MDPLEEFCVRLDRGCREAAIILERRGSGEIDENEAMFALMNLRRSFNDTVTNAFSLLTLEVTRRESTDGE